MVTLVSIFYPLEMISIKSERRHCPNRVKKREKKKKSKLATITFLALGDDREIKPHAREPTTDENGKLEKFSLVSLLTLHFP